MNSLLFSVMNKNDINWVGVSEKECLDFDFKVTWFEIENSPYQLILKVYPAEDAEVYFFDTEVDAKRQFKLFLEEVLEETEIEEDQNTIKGLINKYEK